MLIRPETETDIEAITHVTAEAFKAVDVSNQTEPFIVKALRSAGVLTVSLVAEIEGAVVGHAAFSPVSMSDGSEGWYGLGPVSVLPGFQKRGIASTLIEKGIFDLKMMNGKGCVLVGTPAFYKRFGFENASCLKVEGVPPKVFMVLSFGDAVPEGTVQFHDAFWVTD